MQCTQAAGVRAGAVAGSVAQQQGTYIPANEGVVEAACPVDLVDILHSGIAGARNGDASVDGRRTEPSHCLIAAHYQQSCVPAHSSTHVSSSCIIAADCQQSSAPGCLTAAVMRPVATLLQLIVSRAVHLPASQQHRSGDGLLE